MSELFTTKPDFRPYTAVANQIPLTEMNPDSTPVPGAPAAEPMTAMQQAWMSRRC
jgi:hypothetical protein